MKQLIISSLFAASALALTFPATAQDVLKLKLGHVAPTDEPYHQAAEKFAELVNKNTGGSRGQRRGLLR